MWSWSLLGLLGEDSNMEQSSEDRFSSRTKALHLLIDGIISKGLPFFLVSCGSVGFNLMTLT